MINRTLWEQWELVNYIANKDFGGSVISPDTFNRLIKIVNMDLFKIKMGLPEDYQPGSPISRQSIDLNSRLTSETKFLKEFAPNSTVTNGVLDYPSGLFDIEDIRYNYQRNIDGSPTVIPKPVERLTEAEYSDRAGNYTKQPTLENPVCIFRDNGVAIYPAAIDSVDLSYVRYPNEPVFDYDLSPGYITDGGASVNYEWGDHLFMDLTRMILGYVGINLREEQVQQYAEMHKQQGV